MEKKTPLYQIHEEYHGKIVPFAGFLLPIQYQNGILHEHQLVREKVGLFDVSHMGEFTLCGEDSLINLNYLLTNDYTNMVDGQVRYGVLCYENGTTIDDLLVYRIAKDDYLIVVNASNIEKDFDWIKVHLQGKVKFDNISEQVAQIAIQGPKALDVIQRLTSDIPLKNYTFKQHVLLNNIDCLLSHTGYTGEDGFEIYCANDDAIALWHTLMTYGQDVGIEPCGLGCRDTLRLEAGMPLYGHELSDQITPMESGLGFFVKLDKDFIGRTILEKSSTRQRIGLQLIDRGIARENSRIYLDDQEVGFTTSGTYSPTLGYPIAMAIIDKPFIGEDLIYQIDVRGKKLKAKQTTLPFYKRKKKEEIK